jgi:hypothetical protein
MKKRKILTKGISVFIISLLVCMLINPDIVRIVLGREGRYSDIEEMERIFQSFDSEHIPKTSSRKHIHKTKHTYSDGSWIYVLATDSHHGGGTVGVLESSGKQHFYFGHNCGFGEGLFLDFGSNHFNPDQSRSGCRKIK